MEQLYTYRSLIQEIPTIREDLIKLQSLWLIPDSEMRQIRLIIEEIFSNVIRYAFSDSKEHMVQVKLIKSKAKYAFRSLMMVSPSIPLSTKPGHQRIQHHL